MSVIVRVLFDSCIFIYYTMKRDYPLFSYLSFVFEMLFMFLMFIRNGYTGGNQGIKALTGLMKRRKFVKNPNTLGKKKKEKNRISSVTSR